MEGLIQFPTNAEYAGPYLDGFQYIVDTLGQWGLTLCAGVTGGGLIHFLKYLAPLGTSTPDSDPSENIEFFTIGEYIAGFVPLGYFLATGRIASAAATTGAATKLLTCGATDAKLHNIPAVYIVPISAPSAAGYSPLQDSSRHGLNIVGQLEAELPGSAFLLEGNGDIDLKLAAAARILADHKPIVLVLDPEGLSNNSFTHGHITQPKRGTAALARRIHLIDTLPDRLHQKKVVLLVGEEMARCRNGRALTTELSEVLGAAVVYSINGANAVDRENPRCYGYISFGGNEVATDVWNAVDDKTIILSLGCDFDEYTTGTKPILSGDIWIFTNGIEGYGPVNGTYSHRFKGGCIEVLGEMEESLNYFLQRLREVKPDIVRYPPAPANLNTRQPPRAREGFVDLYNFYKKIDSLWRQNSIGFDDVCISYKDRQYVTQRPNQLCPFYSLYRGSAMGGALGLGVGAKLGDPTRAVFVFTGDGCFRLISGGLSEMSGLGLNVFVLDNQTYGIVHHGLTKILSDTPSERYHSDLCNLDYASIAAGHGWDHRRIAEDLSNLEEVMDRCYRPAQRSVLIELRIDPTQDLGQNPRLANL